MKKLAIFVSGTGSLLEYFIQQGLSIDLVLGDRACRAVDIALKHHLPTGNIVRDNFGKTFDRKSYTKRVLKVLETEGIDMVAMAGYHTILDPSLSDAYEGRILNTHPALLPAFKGHYAVRDALAFGAKVSGCTIHIATKELDDGPILAQAAVGVYAHDSEETLHERIKEVERPLYLNTIRAFRAQM